MALVPGDYCHDDRTQSRLKPLLRFESRLKPLLQAAPTDAAPTDSIAAGSRSYGLNRG